MAVGKRLAREETKEWRTPCSLGFSCEPRDPCPHPLQANETFAFVGNVTHYAQVWLNISAEIRSYLEQGRLQRHLRWLQEVLGAPGGGGAHPCPGPPPEPVLPHPSMWQSCGCTLRP